MDGLLARLRLDHPGFTLDVDLQLPGAGVSVLFGPSGCGKTSCLRAIAGLDRARGRVEVNGDVWQDDAQHRFLPTHARSLGYVFQEASLFEHLSVRRNVDYGLRRVPAGRRNGELAKAVELLGIGALLERRPATLSGGERQRVAIARALAASPQLLLMDEPLAALDAQRKAEVLPYLERLQGELRIPIVYVTHSTDEMARLADTLVVLADGRVVAAGPVASVMATLAGPLVAGEEAGVLLEGAVAERDARWQLARVEFAGGELWLRDDGLTLGQRVRVRVLARDVSVVTALPPQRSTSIQNLLACEVLSVTADAHPSQALVRLALGTQTLLLARVTARAVDALALAPGQAVWAQVKSAALVE